MFARRASFFFLGLVAIAVLCAVPALGWAGSPAGAGAFGTHQWILHEANRQSVLQGFDWADMAIAQPASDEPDTLPDDTLHHFYDVWGPTPYGDGPQTS